MTPAMPLLGKPLPQEDEIRRLQESLSLATSKAKDSNRALVAVIRGLCNAFEWSFGEAWVLSRDGTVLKPGPAWPRTNPDYRKFRSASRRMGFLSGAGLPGRAWRARAPLWVEDIETEPATHYTRRQLALDGGLRSAVALPLASGEDVVSVVVLYRDEPAPTDDAQLASMATVVAPLGPVVARKRVEVELAERERQQKAVAHLGLHALEETTDVEALLDEAVRVAAETLGVEYCKLLECQSDTGTLLLRAGIGWRPGLLGTCEVVADRGSQAGFTLLCGKPVIVQDLDREERFTPSRLLREHDVVSGLSVIVHGHQSPFGVLAVHARQRRPFTPDDVHFLQAVANVVGTALERNRTQAELDDHRRHLEKLVAQRTDQLEASYERLRTAERLASIGTLAAGLGHDLGNTILPILCRLDALEAESLGPKAREELAAVRHAVEYLRQLSQGLRLFALDPRDSTASTGVTVLEDWWECVSPLLLNALPKRIALHAEFASELPPVAVATHRLSQAVLNLVSNAAEAITGRGRVRIRAERVEDDLVHLTVDDNGRGMSPEVRKHSLDPFFTTKTRGLSTGLGLALAHAVAQTSGGTLEIESEEGKGTSVILALPVADGGRLRPRRERVATISLSDPRIASYVRLLIRSLGVEVASQSNSDPANSDPANDEPGESDVWVTEPTTETLEAARSYVKRDPNRRVLFFGEDPALGHEPGFIFIDRRRGPDAMRQAVMQLLENDESDTSDSHPVRG